MGYDLHITRKDCWGEEEDKRSISILEWKAYVKSDPEIFLDAENPDENNYLYIRADANWPLQFNPRLGNIYTKNPPDDVLEKVVKIAAVLKARVQGDDQEFYDLEGNMVSPQEQFTTVNDSKNTSSNDRYIWYFCAIVLVTSIVWHVFIQ